LRGGSTPTKPSAPFQRVDRTLQSFDMTNDPIEAMKERFRKLENDLKSLLESTQDDLHLARTLQKHLTPTEIPQLPGLKGSVRYVSAMEMNSESFDFIPLKSNKELWIIQSWTSSFGLSSVLMQSLIRVKSAQILEKQENPLPEVIFDLLTDTIVEAQKKGSYRLSIHKLDLKKLELSGVSIGQAPVLTRAYEKGLLGNFAWIAPESLISNPELLKPANSTQPISSLRAYRYNTILQPGTRLYFSGKQWNSESSFEEYAKPLKLGNIQENDRDDSLLSNMNHLSIRMQEHLEKTEHKSDLTLIGLEIDPRTLRLA